MHHLVPLLLAQTPESPGIGQLLLGFVTPGGLASLLTVAGALVGGVLWFTTRRKRLIGLASYYAFHIVEDIGAEIDGDDGFDKTARFLKELDDYMVANGWRPLKPGETELAKLQASALHGAEVAKVKVAIAAAEAAADAANEAAPTPPDRPSVLVPPPPNP